jgi:hypothetical protein
VTIDTSWLDLARRMTMPMEFGYLAEWRLTRANARVESHRLRSGAMSDTTREYTPNSHLKGVTGEVAFCLAFGLDLEATIRVDLWSGDLGIDARINDVTIDVKCQGNVRSLVSDLPTGKQPPRAEVFVLTHYQGNHPRDRAVLVGWCTREELLAAPEDDLGWGPRLVLPAHLLRDHGDMALTGLRRFLDAAPPK